MKKLHESLKRKRQQQMYKVLTIYCFQNFLLSEILELGWKRQIDGRSHLSDHRRVKTWFEIQKGREREAARGHCTWREEYNERQKSIFGEVRFNK